MCCVPCRAVDWALAGTTAQYILKIQKTKKTVLFVETASLQLLGFGWVAKAVLNVNREFWQFKEIANVAGTSSNLLEASPELYSIYFGITCSYTVTSCFGILSDENVGVTTITITILLVLSFTWETEISTSRTAIAIQRPCPLCFLSEFKGFRGVHILQVYTWWVFCSI